eukprot:SAG22_NODE_6735_length_818_cov_0.972184_1_plen_34_part_10
MRRMRRRSPESEEGSEEGSEVLEAESEPDLKAEQ